MMVLGYVSESRDAAPRAAPTRCVDAMGWLRNIVYEAARYMLLNCRFIRR